MGKPWAREEEAKRWAQARLSSLHKGGQVKMGAGENRTPPKERNFLSGNLWCQQAMRLNEGQHVTTRGVSRR